MDRFLSSTEQADFERWTSSVSFSSDAETNEFLIAFKLGQILGRPPMSVLRASRGNRGFKDLETAVLLEVAPDDTIEHWMDGRVRRLRFTTPRRSQIRTRASVSLEEAARICECTEAEMVSYRVRTMPGHSELGLGDDEYDPLEVVAVYIAVGLQACRYPRDRIDRFVVQFLASPPIGEDWAVDVTPRTGRLEIVQGAAIGRLDGRRNARWLRAAGAYSALRELGLPVAPPPSATESGE